MLTGYIPKTMDVLKTDATRRSYERWLIRFTKWKFDNCPDDPISHGLVIRYMAELKEAKVSESNRIQALSAIKKLVDTIHKDDQEAIDIYTKLVIESIELPKRNPQLTGKMIPDEDVVSLLECCKAAPKPAGIRDAAIITMLHSTGIRRDECASLVMADYTPAEDKLFLKRTKNGMDRVAYLSDGAVQYLERWLSLRGRSPGPLFWRTRRNGDLWTGRGISGSAIYNIVIRRCEEAGVEICKPHDFRRTLISNLLDKLDIALVSRIAGHSSTAMTAKYDRRDDLAMRAAIKKMKTPY